MLPPPLPLLVGLFGYAGAVEALARDLDSPPWWSWLWLAVPATVASWLVLLLGRPTRPASAGHRRS